MPPRSAGACLEQELMSHILEIDAKLDALSAEVQKGFAAISVAPISSSQPAARCHAGAPWPEPEGDSVDLDELVAKPPAVDPSLVEPVPVDEPCLSEPGHIHEAIRDEPCEGEMSVSVCSSPDIDLDMSINGAEFGHARKSRRGRTSRRSTKSSIEVAFQEEESWTQSKVRFSSSQLRTSVGSQRNSVFDPSKSMEKLQSLITARQRSQGVFSESLMNFLEDSESSTAAFVYSIFRPLFILASVVFTLFQALESASNMGENFAGIVEAIIDALFAVEILLRFLVCKNRFVFWLQPYNIIDLLSAVPLAVRAGTDFRLSRSDDNWHHYFLFGFVPVLRLTKVLRRFRQFNLLITAFKRTIEAMPVLLFIYLVQVLLGTAFIYTFEDRDNVASLNDAMWLAIVSMTTVGYGEIYPKTAGGKMAVSVLVVFGTLYMAIPLGIIGTCFSTVWGDRDRILLIQGLRKRMVEFGLKGSDLPKLFETFDHDRDKKLNFNEFRDMLEMLKLGFDSERITLLFEVFDCDGSGVLEEQEFVRCLFPSAYYTLYNVSPARQTVAAFRGGGDDGAAMMQKMQSLNLAI